MKTIRVLLNGKRAGLERVRAAIYGARERGAVEVRVTWERGDIPRLVREAHAEGVGRIVAGGGDGTIQETVDALMHLPPRERPELAVLPLGTANDLACACGIPAEPLAALYLAQEGRARGVDCVRAQAKGLHTHFMNVASCGLAAEATRDASEGLKNVLRGGAYTFAALIKARNFTPYQARLRLPGREIKGEFILGAVCNGRQAGGGTPLAPAAFIDDGLLDIMAMRGVGSGNIGQIVHELFSSNPGGDFIKRFQAPWAELSADRDIPINLDGEPVDVRRVLFEAVPGAIRLVLPLFCPLLVLRGTPRPVLP